MLLEEEYRKYSLGGPITLMAVGGAVGVVALYVGVLVESSLFLCGSGGDCDGDGTPYFAVGVVGLAAAVGGLIWMLNRISDRAPIRREIYRLRRELQGSYHYGFLDVMPARHGAGLRLSATF